MINKRNASKKEAIELGIKLKSLITLDYLHSGHSKHIYVQVIDDDKPKNNFISFISQ